jgi:hypothetical protein
VELAIKPLFLPLQHTLLEGTAMDVLFAYCSITAMAGCGMPIYEHQLTIINSQQLKTD